MQRVSALLPTWDKRNSGGAKPKPAQPAAGLGWWSTTARAPNRSSSGPNGLSKINIAAANSASDSNRVHREAFWPATLDLECEKAARILKSFCCDGFLASADDSPASARSSTTSMASTPGTSLKITKKIPRRVIQNAAGIAVFTCMRNGLWMTGSGGSGILIARKSDGTWSPPSGIMLHTPTLSFIIGVDVYDCVLVVSNLAALESITKSRVTLGEDVGLTSGPLVTPESAEVDIRWKDMENSVLTYMKARGQHQHVNLNGCILTERANENERFYNSNVTQMDILAGNVRRNVEETTPLFEVIKMAEGRTDFDSKVVARIAAAPAPGDAVIATPKSTPQSPHTAFGLPSVDDPDPFGVLALEMAGMEIREAGSQVRPTSSQFDISMNSSSPLRSRFSRQSIGSVASRSNRESAMSTRTAKSVVTDAGTQTDTGKSSPSPSRGEREVEDISPVTGTDANDANEPDYTKVDTTPLKHLSQSTSMGTIPENETASIDSKRDTAVFASGPSTDSSDQTSKLSSVYDRDDDAGNETNDTNDADDEDDETDEDDEEPVVFEVAQVQQPVRPQAAVASRMIAAKGNVVTIPKRLPPPLPTRSPARRSRISQSDMGGDVAPLRSPLREEFDPESQGDDASPADEAAANTDADAALDKLTNGDAPQQIPRRNPLRDEVPSKDQDEQIGEAHEEVSETKAAAELEDFDESSAAQGPQITYDLADETMPTGDDYTESPASKETDTAEPRSQSPTQPATAEELQQETETANADARQSVGDEPDSTESEHQDPAQSSPRASFAEEAADLAQENEATGSPVSDADKGTAEDLSDAQSSVVNHQEPEDEKDESAQSGSEVFEPRTPQKEKDHSDHSDSTSTKKHTSSVFTGATEDRWSFDGSAVTTPTSERPFSALGVASGDDTPTKEKDATLSADAKDEEIEGRQTTPVKAST